MSARFSRSLIINYVGIPNIITALMPDVGIALLSSCLKQEGHFTKILDYSSLEAMEILTPPIEIRDEFNKIVGGLKSYFENNNPSINRSILKFDIFKYRKILNKFEEVIKINRWQIAQKIIDEVNKERINFVGFKLWGGESFKGSIEIAKILKKAKTSLKIIAGGPHASLFREYIYKETNIFDAIVYDEGEQAITRFAEYSLGKCKLKDIPNVIYQKGADICINKERRILDLNKLPFPDYSYENYPALLNDNKIKVFLIEESRGCPNRCNFCVHPLVSGNKQRIKSPKRTVDEIVSIIGLHGSKYYRLAGSNPPANLCMGIAKEILNRAIKIRYSTFGHINLFSNCHLTGFELLAKSGCHSMLFGLESGSHQLQKHVINKVIPLSKAKYVLNACKKSKINTVVSLIYPNPFENPITKKETIDYVKEIKPNSVLTYFPILSPRTKWFLDCGKYNIKIPSRESFFKKMLTYQIRWNYHPILWEPVNYKINGLDFRQIAIELSKFADEFKKHKFPTQITEEDMLFARAIRMNYIQFTKIVSRAMSDYNIKKLRTIIGKINTSSNHV